jgi:DNA-binding MarR family transcriptional regulator
MPRARTRTSRRSSEVNEAARPVDLDILPTLLGFNIRRAQIALWRDFTRSVAEGEVRPGVFSVLSIASSNPGIAQIDIANQLDIDKASVVALIDWLENEGWVERKRSVEDRRRHEISVTAAGMKAYKSLKREMLQHERRFIKRFTQAEHKQLLSLLKRLHE